MHGLTGESFAREKYEEKNNVKVLEAGSLIRPEMPWASYSSDGIVLNDKGEPLLIIEVKSPVELKRLKSGELLENHCIQLLDRNGNFKTRHMHSGQVHLVSLLRM